MFSNGVAQGRERLPDTRAGYNQKVKIGGQTVYLRTGEYADGRLGEIFIDVSKAGSTMRAMCGALAVAVSKALQRGVPLGLIVEDYRGWKFEPSGTVVGDPRITEADSILDYVFRELELTYIKKEFPSRNDAVVETVEWLKEVEKEVKDAQPVDRYGRKVDSVCKACGRDPNERAWDDVRNRGPNPVSGAGSSLHQALEPGAFGSVLPGFEKK